MNDNAALVARAGRNIVAAVRRVSLFTYIHPYTLTDRQRGEEGVGRGREEIDCVCVYACIYT